uniref:Uncharacterized protein n=1 Tax=viral metagenome TaxID=1070528 RepID=A0A6M3J1W0_9ZZZZ
MIERITDIEGVDIEWIGEAPIEPKLEALAEEKLPGTAISRALDPIENEWLKTMELEGIPTGGPLRGEKEFRGIPALAPFVGGVGKPRPEMTSDMWEEVAKREMKGAIEGLAAVGEVPTTILTGLAGFVGGGVSSGASLVQSGLANLFGADVSMKEALEESIKAGEETAGMMTWQPRTKLAQEAVEVAMTPTHWVVDKVRGFGNFLIDKGIPIIDENATPQQIVDELEAWNRGERRMNPAMVTAITTPLELYAIGKMLSKAHGAAKSIGKDLYPTLPKPTDIGISRRELNKIDKQILAELMEKKPPPEPPPEPPGPPGGIARTPEELSRLKEPLEKSPIGSSAESLMETVVEEPKVEIKTDALSGEKIVTVEEVPKTRAEVRKARAKKKVVDEDEGVPGVKSLEEPPAPVAGEVIEEPIPSKPDLKIVPKKEKAPIEEHYPSAEEIGVEGVADALQEVNKSLSRAEAIKQAEGIVAYKTKPVGGEAPTMSKAEWEDKYSIGDYEYHQGKLPLINLKTRPGQLRALEFIRSVTKDPLEQIVKDEMLSMMRENIFTYEEAVKAGKVRMPTAKEAPSAPELFDSTTTGTPHWDGLLKKGEAKIVRMTPDEYLEQQAKAKGTYPEDVSQYVLDETVVEYVERMKKGEKAPLPLIDWVEKTQEGRARVLAAKKLGQKEIPVLVREKVPKAIPPERLIDQISRLYDEGKSVEEIAKKLVMEEEAVLDRLAYLEKSRAKNVVTLEEIEPEIKEALNSAEGNLETAYNNLRKLVDKYEESFDYAFTNEGELGAFRLRTDEVLGGILEKMRKDGIVPTPDVEGKVESFPYDDPTRQGGFTTRGAAERYADSFDIEGEIIENSDVPGRFVFKKGKGDVTLYSGIPIEEVAKLVRESWQELRGIDTKLREKIRDWITGKSSIKPSPLSLYRGVPKGAGILAGDIEYVHGTPWAFKAARGGKGAFGDPESYDVYKLPIKDDVIYYRGGSLSGDPLESTRIRNSKGMAWDELLDETKVLYETDLISERAKSRKGEYQLSEGDMKWIAEKAVDDLANASFEVDLRDKPGIWRGQHVPYELDRKTPRLRSNEDLREAIRTKRSQGISDEDIPEIRILELADVDIGFGGYEMWGKAYRDFVNKMKSRSEKTGEKISEKGTEILDKGEIVQRRQIQGMLRPPIYKAEHEVVKGAKTLDENQYWGRAFQNPIYTFKEAGGEAMLDLTIHPYNDRVWAATWMKKKIGKTRKELFNSVSRGDRKKIGIYAINKQKRGPRLLANSGVEKGTIAKAIQDVESNPKLIEAYNKLRDRYESWYTRLNRVRQAIGKKPFPKEDDYFTFIRTLSMMERMGFKPMQTGTDLFTSQYAKAGATPFRFAKRRRGGKYRAELDPFRVLETYENVAIDHVQLSPLIAKLRELQASIKDPDTGKTYNLANSNPVLAKALHEWTNHIAGMKSPKWQISPGAEAVLLRVNNNLVASILGANVRSALIQPMALKNTMSRIGFTYTARGIASLLWDAPNTFREVGGIVARGEPMSRGPAMRTSKTLLPRVFETVQADVIDSIIRGQGKKWLTKQSLKPLQILDYITAKATYNGAYDYAIKELGYSAKKAVTFADDTVVTTQASALPGHIAPIQRSVAGRTLTLFQTFVINDWNFLMRHVLGKSNVDISNAQAFTRTMRWVAAATLFNILYEDILGINSPLPTPIKSFKESLEKGDSLPSLAWNVGKEFIEPVPIIGSARYGKGPGGPVAELAQETIKHVASQPSTKSGTEVLGSWLGIPGTQQWAKIGRARKRGETPYGQVVGTYTPKKKSRRTRGGFGGMGGGMGGL